MEQTPSKLAILGYAGPSEKTPGAMSRFMSTPPGWIFNAAVMVAAALSLYAHCVYDLYLFAEMFSLLMFMILGVSWVARFLGSIVLSRRYNQPQAMPWRRWKNWMIAPLVVLCTEGLLAAEVPSNLAFAYSRPALERAAKAALANPSVNVPVDVGFYGTCVPNVDGSTVYFRLDGDGFIDSAGFAYCATGTPAPGGRGRCWPMTGPWYRWYQRF